VRCHLSEFRGSRSIREIAREAGINPGQLSEIEAGRRLPRDEEIPKLAEVYGAPLSKWYPPLVLVALEVEDVELERLRIEMIEAWVARSTKGGE
jgi:transcriptional regulator with XRE-family HTH domain